MQTIEQNIATHYRRLQDITAQDLAALPIEDFTIQYNQAQQIFATANADLKIVQKLNGDIAMADQIRLQQEILAVHALRVRGQTVVGLTTQSPPSQLQDGIVGLFEKAFNDSGIQTVRQRQCVDTSSHHGVVFWQQTCANVGDSVTGCSLSMGIRLRNCNTQEEQQIDLHPENLAGYGRDQQTASSDLLGNLSKYDITVAMWPKLRLLFPLR